MKFLSDILAKAGLTVDGVVTLNNTATGQTPATNDNSTKLATTAFIKNQSYITANQTITVSGDATGSGTTSIALTLANSGVTAGVYGNASNIPTITVDAKGRITSISTNAVSIVTTLAGLSDVTLTSPSVNQVLQYNGTQWVNGAAPTTYTLPIATESTLGGIKVGSGLSINAVTGVLSATAGSNSSSVKSTQTFIATAGQTVFTISGGYTVGLIDVFLNGVYLSPNQTTASNGTTVTLGTAAAVDDIIDVIIASPIYQGSTVTSDQLPEGSTNLYFTNARVLSALSGRTLTINGVTYDLSANRSWSVGTVTSVAALTIGTSGTDITSSVATGTTTPVITLNIPDASASARGVVTTSSQTFAGAKIFSSTVAINNTSPHDPSQFSLDINGGLLVKNTGKLAQFVLINSNPATGGNNGFVQHTVGGTSGSSYADIQGYYGQAVSGSTVIRLNPLGGNVLVGSLAGTGTRIVVADATGVLSTQAAQTLNDLNGVPTSRTITINGTTFDLTANRSFTINSMVYPGAGIAVSTGTAWGTSLTDNSANWNTAFGWGNHASAGYATTTYVNTQVANLVASAPATLDTLNELAAALGNDAAFSTTVTTALGNRLRIDTASQGLNGTQQSNGRTNLGLGSLATLSSIGDTYITDLAYSKLTGVPSTFAPSAHTHDDRYYTETEIGNFFSGASAITGYNKTNWDTAYGWGNHASGGYLTTASAASTYVSLSGSYANPAWITSLAWSKITGAPAFITGITSGMVTTALGYTPYNATNPNGYITGYTETDTLASVTGRGATTGTAIVMSGGSGTTATLMLDRNIATPSNYYSGLQFEVRATSGTAGIGLHRNGFSHIGIYHDTTNVLKFDMNGGTVTLNHNVGTVYGTGTLTNLNQLTNGPGYITGYTETDTLSSVTGRGASTSSAITVNNKIEVSRNGAYGGYVDADLIIGHGGNDRRGYGQTGGSNIMLRSSSKSTITALDESNNLGQLSYENLVWTIGEDIGWGVQRVDFPGVVNLSSTLRLPNNSLISVNNEPDVWGARFRTTASTTNLGAGLKNIIWTGGGSTEGFAVTGSGTGGASFEVRNDGRGWFKGDLTVQSNMYVLADGSAGYVASRIWLYSHNNYRGAGIYLSGTGSTWFAGTGYTDFDGTYIISRRSVAGDDSTAWSNYRLWQVSSSGNTYQTGSISADGTINSASSIYATAATARIQAGSTSSADILYDSSRSALVARGNYPHVEIFSEVSNSNHGGTLRFTGYDNGSSGAYKSWNIGAPGSDLYFLDIAYGGTSNSNPHAGIAGLGSAYSYPNAFNMMRFHNNGNIGVGNFGTYGSGDNTPAYKLDVRGTGRFTGALSANTSLTVGGGGDALAIAGAEGRITFRDQALVWTGYVGFRGNLGVIEYPGRNVQVSCGYNGYVEINTGTNDYLSGRLTVPFGSVNARRGFTSDDNPWNTANSSFHPNGITTGGSTNWIYGLTYLGNAPSNGSGAEVAGNGRSYFRSSNTSGTWGYAGRFIDRNSAANNYVPWSFENEYGNHSWGIVARFHMQSNSGTDRPSIQFSSDFNNNRWSVGYCYPDDNFRITQNHGYRPDNSTNDGWGTERFRINTDGATYCFSSFTASGDVTAYSDIRVKTNIETVTNAVEKIQSIRGVTFTRTDTEDKERKHLGVVAQEVLDILPEVISETDKGLYTVAYGNMAGLFIEAIKEQQLQIESQKSEIEELKDLVKQLINR